MSTHAGSSSSRPLIKLRAKATFRFHSWNCPSVSWASLGREIEDRVANGRVQDPLEHSTRGRDPVDSFREVEKRHIALEVADQTLDVAVTWLAGVLERDDKVIEKRFESLELVAPDEEVGLNLATAIGIGLGDVARCKAAARTTSIGAEHRQKRSDQTVILCRLDHLST